MNSKSYTPQSSVPRQSTPLAGNIFFALLMAGMALYFVIWGLDYTNHQQMVLFFIAAFFGIFMAFNIGGNDVANSFGTSVGAGTLSVTQALLVAAIFEVSGAVLAGAAVTDTIRSKIVDLNGLNVLPTQFIFVMLSALVAASLWLLFATKKGLPVSTTHAIIGGIVGSSIVLGINLGGTELAFSTVKWSKIKDIALSWVLSPVLGGVISYMIYGQIKKHILLYNDKTEEHIKTLKTQKKQLKNDHASRLEQMTDKDKLSYMTSLVHDENLYGEKDYNKDDFKTDYYKAIVAIDEQRDAIDSLKALTNYVPLIAALGSTVITSLVVFKGLKNTGLDLGVVYSTIVILMIAAIIWLAVFIYTKTIRGKHKDELGKATFIMFGWMQVFTASAFAFSHGSNDIANAVGPFVAIIDVIRTNAIEAKALVPHPVMLTFGVALIVGLWFIGKEVIQTVGTNLAKMHPASGFSAELAAAAVVMGASAFGLPVSSTHILVGAVLGIGMVNKDTNWKLMKPIALAWVITLPASMVMSALAFIAFNAIF